MTENKPRVILKNDWQLRFVFPPQSWVLKVFRQVKFAEMQLAVTSAKRRIYFKAIMVSHSLIETQHQKALRPQEQIESGTQMQSIFHLF